MDVPFIFDVIHQHSTHLLVPGQSEHPCMCTCTQQVSGYHVDVNLRSFLPDCGIRAEIFRSTAVVWVSSVPGFGNLPARCVVRAASKNSQRPLHAVAVAVCNLHNSVQQRSGIHYTSRQPTHACFNAVSDTALKHHASSRSTPEPRMSNTCTKLMHPTLPPLYIVGTYSHTSLHLLLPTDLTHTVGYSRGLYQAHMLSAHLPLASCP